VARIRHIFIENFRGIKNFEWFPLPGINCLVGPGDCGKSTVLDAIDCCLGARRSIPFNDADFFGMDVSKPIQILVTLGELDDSLKTLDRYGLYVRGFNSKLKKVEEEPDHDLETVLTIQQTVTNSLEAEWSLVSERAKEQDLRRDLGWGDRVKIAPTRIGTIADHHLGWGRGSVLNRLSEERADASTALAQAARDVRKTFGDQAEKQLEKALKIVEETATLTNSGAATMSDFAVNVVGAKAKNFSQTSTCGSTIAAGATCILALTFSPDDKGRLSATVNITFNVAGLKHTQSP